jgi:hypothetical protein
MARHDFGLGDENFEGIPNSEISQWDEFKVRLFEETADSRSESVAVASRTLWDYLWP